MYSSISTWYPIPGQEQKFLADATAYIHENQAQGKQCGLYRQLYSTDGDAITLNFVYPNLAAVEAVQDANARDADYQALMAETNAACRIPTVWQLWEDIIPANHENNRKYVEVTHIYPKTSKEGQVVAVLSEWVKSEQAKRSIGLSVNMLDPDGRTLRVVEVWPSLTAFGAERQAGLANTATSETAAELGSLCQRPQAASLHRVVVNYPD